MRGKKAKLLHKICFGGDNNIINKYIKLDDGSIVGLPERRAYRKAKKIEKGR